MFLGHFALGFAAKKVAPAASLGTLFLATQLVDLLWATFLLLGIERVAVDPGNTAFTPLDFVHYPVTHGLITGLFWAAALAGTYMLLRRYPRGAAAVWLLVLSHWVLDLVAHRPDLPIVPGSGFKVGLGLWNSVPATLAVEFALFALGVWLYARATVARDRTGAWALWTLVAFLAVIQLANAFGPPPPSATAIAWVGHATWLLVAWGYWIDRHRAARVPA